MDANREILLDCNQNHPIVAHMIGGFRDGGQVGSVPNYPIAHSTCAL